MSNFSNDTILQPLVTMDQANEKIPVYTGEFILKIGSIEIIVNGDMNFRWLLASMSHTFEKKDTKVKTTSD